MKKMLKLVYAVAGLIIASNALADANHAKVSINFPTASASGALYAVGAAITHLWDEKIDYVSASSQASAGGIDNLNQVAEGEAQVSIAISSNCYQALNGTDSFEGFAYPDLKVIAGLYFNPNQVVVTGKSGIKSLEDVTGKHFAVASTSALSASLETHFIAMVSFLKHKKSTSTSLKPFSEASSLLPCFMELKRIGALP